jgi:tetratricopeptide (TPR) repeat protein
VEVLTAKLGKYELAIADFNRVIELDPKNEEAYQQPRLGPEIQRRPQRSLQGLELQ